MSFGVVEPRQDGDPPTSSSECRWFASIRQFNFEATFTCAERAGGYAQRMVCSDKFPSAVGSSSLLGRRDLSNAVQQAVRQAPVHDIHTHLYGPAFGDLLSWGIDNLLIYHYLVAEGFRSWELPYEQFWALEKATQAELIWKALFIEHSPISEACRGVLTVLQSLGLDANARDLPALRCWFADQEVENHLSRVMELAGVHTICMTNSPFDEAEHAVWLGRGSTDVRFTSALRIDPLLLDWPTAHARLASWGYRVAPSLNEATLSEVRRFLADWTRRMNPLYLMVSLPPGFSYPSNDETVRILEGAVLPHCLEHDSALALMPGVNRAVNPALRLAGDGVGRADMAAYERLLAIFPKNRFLMTVLSRENQHELCVLARKFRNLHVFGCWWFTNVPSLIDEITRMRLELLGFSMTVQHSDARVLEQLIYKWSHTRRVVAKVLDEKYCDLADTGWHITRADIERDVQALFGGSFEAFLQRRL